MFQKTLWFSLAAAATLIAGAVLAGPKPATRAISAHQISKSDPLHVDAVRGHKGTLLGVTADPRARAFLNQNGILH